MKSSKMVKKKKSQKSKMDAFIPKMMDSAYDMEKTRRDYLRQCSEHYNKKLYDCLMQLKCFWMKLEDVQVELEISGNENVDEYVKNSALRRKLCQQQEPKEQEKKKRKSTGRPRVQPPKKHDLRMKASDPFGVKRGKKVKFIDAPAAE